LSNVLLTFSLQILCRYKVGCDLPGKYRVALDSDALVFGGHGRVSNMARWQIGWRIVPFINWGQKLYQDMAFARLILVMAQVGHDVDHFTSPEGVPGVPETNFNNRPNSFKILSPPRTCVVMSIFSFCQSVIAAVQ
jgi:1,4-alpha-glucan branching enzyme